MYVCIASECNNCVHSHHGLQMEYAKEGLDGLVISYKDNKPVLDLFLTRPIGLLSLLDEQCRGLNVRALLFS